MMDGEMARCCLEIVKGRRFGEMMPSFTRYSHQLLSRASPSRTALMSTTLVIFMILTGAGAEPRRRAIEKGMVLFSD